MWCWGQASTLCGRQRPTDSQAGCHQSHLPHIMSLQMPHTHLTALLPGHTSRSRL